MHFVLLCPKSVDKVNKIYQFKTQSSCWFRCCCCCFVVVAVVVVVVVYISANTPDLCTLWGHTLKSNHSVPQTKPNPLKHLPVLHAVHGEPCAYNPRRRNCRLELNRIVIECPNFGNSCSLSNFKLRLRCAHHLRSMFWNLFLIIIFKAHRERWQVNILSHFHSCYG